ncbi:NACHT domain-containing protein [Streptomyces bambusae]|nr:NACHT domain-containing protein [Streptomyces bambusae]
MAGPGREVSGEEGASVIRQSATASGYANVYMAGGNIHVAGAAPEPVGEPVRGAWQVRGQSAVVCLALLVLTVLSGLFFDRGPATGGYLLATAALGALATRLLRPAVRQWRRARLRTDPRVAQRLQRQLDGALTQLRRDLVDRWERENRLRRLQHPRPLPVRWVNADAYADHWPVVLGTHGGEGRPLDLGGRFGELGEVYRRVPSGRLLLLGDAGSGKSVLAARFALDRVREPARGERVPVLLPLASWDPRTHDVTSWAAARLAADHPLLAARTVSGDTVAVELLRAGRLLPVLDGFDELRPEARPAALRALRASLGERDPFVLTSRVAEYEAAVVAADAVLPGAAAVRLEPLTLAEVTDHLRHSVRGTVTDGRTVTKWDPVLTRLRDPDDTGARELRGALSTPLMVSLARAAYGDTGRDPAELLDPALLAGGRASVEDHLLDAAVPQTTDRPDDSERWLRFLARRLEAAATHDLAWWELAPGATRVVRVTAAVLALGATTWLMSWLLHGYRLPFGIGLPVWAPYAALGLLAVADVAVSAPAAVAVPRYLPRPRNAGDVLTLVLLLLAVAYAVLPMAVEASLLAFAAVTAGFVVLTVLLERWRRRIAARDPRAGTPADPDASPWDLFRLRPGAGPGDPARTVRADRTAGLLSLGLVHLGGAGAAVRHVAYLLALPLLLLWSTSTESWDEPPGPGDWGVTAGVVVAALLVAGAGAAAWSGFAVGRTGMWLSGLLPWRLFPFLDEAHRLGVLRQSGYAYQFRHLRMQERLASASAGGGPVPLPRARPRRTPGRRYRPVMSAAFLAGFWAVLLSGLALTPPEGAVRAGVPACGLLTPAEVAAVLPGPYRREAEPSRFLHDYADLYRCQWEPESGGGADPELGSVRIETAVYHAGALQSATGRARRQFDRTPERSGARTENTVTLAGLGDQAVTVLLDPDFFPEAQTHVRVDNLVVSVSYSTVLRTTDPDGRTEALRRAVRASQDLARAALARFTARPRNTTASAGPKAPPSR